MKRHPDLRSLSDDHHTALVLARRTRRAAERGGDDAGVLEAQWRDVVRAFADELEPHFAIEERWLLPRLEAAGETRLVERNCADHARLRELVRESSSAPVLAEFAALLERHVRFEEREVFVRFEALLAEYEDASMRGLCSDGAWEAAIGALRSARRNAQRD